MGAHHLVHYKKEGKVSIIRVAHAKYMYHDPEYLDYLKANAVKII